MKVELAAIIELAENFECCPECGNEYKGKHWCDICQDRVGIPERAYWFAEYLKKLNVKLSEETKK